MCKAEQHPKKQPVVRHAPEKRNRKLIMTAVQPFAAMVKLIKKKTVPLFAVRPINPIGRRLISNTRVLDKLKKAIGHVPHAQKAKCTLRPTNAITRNTANALVRADNTPLRSETIKTFAALKQSKVFTCGVIIIRNVALPANRIPFSTKTVRLNAAVPIKDIGRLVTLNTPA